MNAFDVSHMITTAIFMSFLSSLVGLSYYIVRRSTQRSVLRAEEAYSDWRIKNGLVI